MSDRKNALKALAAHDRGQAMTSAVPSADLRCVGYFEGTDLEPTHWPPDDAPCAICGKALGERDPDVWRCRSVAPAGGARSYFIVYHVHCGSDHMDRLEPAYMDAIFAWDDAARRPQ